MYENFGFAPLSFLYEEAGYLEEIPYCANCNHEVREGGKIDAQFPERDDYNRCRECIGK